jgi:hypothetical protein
MSSLIKVWITSILCKDFMMDSRVNKVTTEVKEVEKQV